MTSKLLRVVPAVLLAAAASFLSATPAGAIQPVRKPTFRLEEQSITSIHWAMSAGKLSCVALIQAYLDRIAAYEPVFNAFLEVNPNALAQAAALDAAGGLTGPLHCIPFGVKDAVDSAEMPSSGGSVPLSRPAPDDATVIARLRAAGAIILGKTNMDELGRGSSGLSTKGGQTGNAYDPTRTPGGSSGGSAVAVAANLTTVAIAEETGVSIRNPCANANIACIAPTQGLVSRDGVIPISFTQDRLGQYGKTIKDAAIVLDVIAGFDPKDPVTANSVGRKSVFGYAAYARPGRLDGKRLGVVREYMTVGGQSDEESVALAEAALDDLEALGATLVDPLPTDAAMGALLPVLNPAYFPNSEWDFPCDSETVLAGDCPNPGFARVVGSARTNSYEFAFAFNRYLIGRADPLVPDLDAFIATGPFFSNNFRNGLIGDGERTTLNDPEYLERLLRRKTIGEVVLKLMADAELDALVFPMKTQPAGKIGAPGNSSGQILSSSSGLPSVLIPIGFTEHVVDRVSGGAPSVVTPAAMPVAIEFLGRPFSEPTLIGIAASYEAATKHRRPSPFAPPLP